MGVVTISAAFGAGGSEIGPAVAQALGLPFVDRAIPAHVAQKLGVPLREAEAKDERVDTGFWRVISSMVFAPDVAGVGPLGYNAVTSEHAYREQTEAVLREVAAGGGVILGRAGAIVLADAAPALHVRLTGDREARAAGHARRIGCPIEDARRELEENDSAREAYVRHLYRRDATECRHYHLVIDTMALSWNAVTSLIVAAARDRDVVQ